MRGVRKCACHLLFWGTRALSASEWPLTTSESWISFLRDEQLLKSQAVLLREANLRLIFRIMSCRILQSLKVNEILPSKPFCTQQQNSILTWLCSKVLYSNMAQRLLKNGSAIFPSTSLPGSFVHEGRGAGMNSRELLRTRFFCCVIFFLDYRGQFEYFLNFSHHKNPLKLSDLPWESHGIRPLNLIPRFSSLVAPRNRSREERDWERSH